MKPILFNTEMVRAILDGRKAVTRRVVKPQPPEGVKEMYPEGNVWRSAGTAVWAEVTPPYHSGDTLWVRETWGIGIQMAGGVIYRADYEGKVPLAAGEHWHPSIHMPREAARLFLRVTAVRVERLQDITDAGAELEGMEWGYNDGDSFSPRDVFSFSWDSTIKPADRDLYGWDANPWVWVIQFARISREEAEGR